MRYALICLPLLGLSGCSWFPYLVGNLVGTPVEVTETCCFDLKLHSLANRAWKEACAARPYIPSPAYADGFHDGFVDFVKRNGPGEPTVPPFCYRYPVLRTPDQQLKIDDWFAGYRDGAAVAREQGWRDGVIVPIGRPSLVSLESFKQEIVPTPSADPPLPLVPHEELPAPRREPDQGDAPRPVAPVPPAASVPPGGTQSSVPTARNVDAATQTSLR
jgi:hypothetical protein